MYNSERTKNPRIYLIDDSSDQLEKNIKKSCASKCLPLY